MTEIAPHIEFDFQERAKRLENRSAEEELSDTMNGAMDTIYSGVFTYAKRKAEEAKQWENAYHAEKAKNEYLVMVMKQYGIPVPDFSIGIPINIPPNMPKQRCDLNTKEKEQSLLGKDGNLNLPKILDTQRAQTYFKMASERGYMKIEGDHFCWLGVNVKGRKSQLAYFCGRIYDYQNSTLGNTGQNFPEEELNNLFQEKELYKLLPQVYTAKKKQGWRTILDSMFES